MARPRRVRSKAQGVPKRARAPTGGAGSAAASAGTGIHDLVAAEIRRARLAAGLTQAQVAARLDKRPSWVAGVENGRRQIYVHDFPRIAQALGMDVDELLRRVMRAAASRG